MKEQHFKIYSMMILLAWAVPYEVVHAEDETWEDLNSAASQAYESGDYQKGVDYAKRALDKALSQHGENHPDTILSLISLAKLHCDLRQYELGSGVATECGKTCRPVGPTSAVIYVA